MSIPPNWILAVKKPATVAVKSGNGLNGGYFLGRNQNAFELRAQNGDVPQK
jgi:hypothetical protein